MGRVRSTHLVAAGAAVLALAGVVARAHRGHAYGNPFHAVSLEEAQQLAQDEFKLVFVYVTPPGGSAPQYLERPSWNDWRTIDLLIRELVAVKLDPARNAEQLAPFQPLDVPAMLVLDADGTLRARLDAQSDSAALIDELRSVMSGAESIARVRAALATADQPDPLLHERLADALARHGDYAAALEQYQWCATQGLNKNVLYGVARRRLLFNGWLALAEQHAPAREALSAYRAALERRVVERDKANAARNLAELNRCLNHEQLTLELYDRLPERSRGRTILFDHVIGMLIAARRYDEVLEMVEPRRAFRQEMQLARARRALWDDAPASRETRGMRAFAVARGALLVEALAGAGRVEEAQQLADDVLRFDDREQTRTLLRKHARRAECNPLVAHLEDDAAPATRAGAANRKP